MAIILTMDVCSYVCSYIHVKYIKNLMNCLCSVVKIEGNAKQRCVMYMNYIQCSQISSPHGIKSAKLILS